MALIQGYISGSPEMALQNYRAGIYPRTNESKALEVA